MVVTYINILFTLWLVPVHKADDEPADNGHSCPVSLHVALHHQALVVGGKDVSCISKVPEFLALSIHLPLGGNLGHYNIVGLPQIG